MSLAEGEGVLDLGDQRLEYRWIAPTVENMPTLVFVHEGLGCVAIWRDFPERVARATGCGALVYSRAGYGKSSPVSVPRPLSYLHDEGLDVLPRLLDKLGLDRVILVGHSDGASISLIHAGGAHGDRLLGVIVEAPHVFNEEVCIASIRAAAEAFSNKDLRAKLQRLHGDNVDCAFLGWSRAWLAPEFEHWNIEHYLPEIPVPVLVIQGRQDEYGTASQYEAIAKQAGAGAEVVVLDDCRHAPHRDRLDATLEAMADFVRSLAPEAVGGTT